MTLKNSIRKRWRRLIRYDEKQRKLSCSLFEEKARKKTAAQEPVTVVFACHEPALWNTVASVFFAMQSDVHFNPVAVVLPYRHPSLPEGEYKDAGMDSFFDDLGISYLQGRTQDTGIWMDPVSLNADYLFYQTPYPLFDDAWSIENVSQTMRVCYVPYATCLFTGPVFEILHPAAFYKYCWFEFLEGPFSCREFKTSFEHADWFREQQVIASGHPKLDYLLKDNAQKGRVWKRGLHAEKRILWTPRWNTEEGNCHFFDYKDWFPKFCENRGDIDFVLRPHPLCFQNFLKTGELTATSLEGMEQAYQTSENMVIDTGGDYEDTFLSCSILVSDISSMMLEFFVTGKPVIYTHRTDQFNEFGTALAKGFYWVETADALHETLEMLLRGEDPLKPVRDELIKELVYRPRAGAGIKIKEVLRDDFKAASFGTGRISDE